LGVHGPGQIAIGFAVFTAAALSPRQLSGRIVVGCVALVLAGALVAPSGPEWAPVILGPACVLVGWLAGERARSRRVAELELADRARADERIRIARDLHDIVAHSMSVIAVRSGAARMVADTNPEEARAALAIIEQTSRDTLRELRRIVGVLRRPEDDAYELLPAPRLADVPDLVRSVQQTGTAVDLRIEGDPHELPEGIEVSAYRIVQEALTNVVRHAGRADARLSIRYRPDGLEIEVINPRASNGDNGAVPRSAVEGTGHGLIGMRERVALYGGELDSGPDGDSYRLLARLPVSEAR
jgi:signal transduction histidine kinase